MNYGLFNMSKGMFNTTLETMLVHHSFLFICFINCKFSSLNTATSFQSRNFNNRASKFFRHCINMNFITILFYDIHHIYSNNHWNTKFCKLCCKIKVSFKVCSIYNVQNCIWAFFYKIFTRNYFFQSIWRKGINTWQVHNYNIIFVTFKFTFFFFYSYSRPVSYELI